MTAPLVADEQVDVVVQPCLRDREGVRDLVDRQVADDDPLLGRNDHEAFLLQPFQRGPHGRFAHPELNGDLPFRQERAGGRCAVKDSFLDLAVGALLEQAAAGGTRGYVRPRRTLQD